MNPLEIKDDIRNLEAMVNETKADSIAQPPTQNTGPEVKLEDTRPQKGNWAPGKYLNNCLVCKCVFPGDKRATSCADCAYQKIEQPESTGEWRVGETSKGDDYLYRTLIKTHHGIAQTLGYTAEESEAIAKRIVAEHNFCAGMSNEEIEVSRPAVQRAYQLAKEIQQLQSQLAEVRKQLNEEREYDGSRGDHNP